MSNVRPSTLTAMAVGESSFSKRTVVIVARHAERLDYVMRDAGDNWIPTTDHPWDPPLSASGWKQGRNLGRRLRQALAELGLPPVAAIYSSPFQRCIQTAMAALDALQDYHDDDHGQNALVDRSTKVLVEEGLAESINESWYRSWCLPESDGTWGFRPIDADGYPVPEIKAESLHPAATKPIQQLLRMNAALDFENGDSYTMKHLDNLHQSHSEITEEYCWGHFESRKEQRERMHRVVELLSSRHQHQTFICFSHGGPVTHLYEKLTGITGVNMEKARTPVLAYTFAVLARMRTTTGSRWLSMRQRFSVL